ncbi:hypothetical protein ACFOY4_03275 [Actinomadura syzygii]|uniref:DUF998 domain-containing protein n=1 Tax=Actinomadura syzygii TaxID=1427538 RepID=A0A5D0UHQ9_9ACTN|nr:hypothetical protein [Actinomadura syzygii]TYC17574.1 hypothetical protein FXF65_06190 [Actinomadura syzygii]
MQESPAAVLDEIGRLRRLTRARVHGAAVPLVVFAGLTLASALLYRHPFFRVPAEGGTLDFSHDPFFVPGNAGGGFAVDPGPVSGYAGLYWADWSAALSILFWLVVAPLCYAGCALWYRRRAESIGLALRWRTWLYAGAGLMGLMVVVLALRQEGPDEYHGSLADHPPLMALSPLLAIALGLLGLAWVERSWGAGAVAVVYGVLAAVMSMYPLGEQPFWIIPPSGGSIDLLMAPGYNLLILTSVLLAGAAILQLRTAARRRKASRA